MTAPAPAGPATISDDKAVMAVRFGNVLGSSGSVIPKFKEQIAKGEPVKIVELAHQMIWLAGHTEAEIRIEFSGLRAGEKLYEELFADEETTVPTPIAQLHWAVTGHRGKPPLERAGGR